MDTVFVGHVLQALEKRIEGLQEGICTGNVPDHSTYVRLRGRLEGLLEAKDVMDEFIRSYDTSQND